MANKKYEEHFGAEDIVVISTYKWCCVKMLPQVHGAGCSQQRQVRVVSAGNLFSNTRIDFLT